MAHIVLDGLKGIGHKTPEEECIEDKQELTKTLNIVKEKNTALKQENETLKKQLQENKYDCISAITIAVLILALLFWFFNKFKISVSHKPQRKE